jgi:hypothetical protein
MARSMKKPGWVAAALLAGAEATAQTASAVEPEAAEPGPVAAEPARRWAAAAGAVASVGPEFAGASRIGVNLQPGFAVRWGRVSLASRSAFAVRSEGAAASPWWPTNCAGLARSVTVPSFSVTARWPPSTR